MKVSFAFLTLLVLSSLELSSTYAQNARAVRKMQKDSITRKAIGDSAFTFTAQTATALGRTSRQLTSTYEVNVTHDTVICFLPYFGRAYIAPVDPSKGGIQFTENHADYSVNQRKKDGWDILIKVRQDDAQQLALTVFQNGSASLIVTSANRDPISFEGYVTPIKKREH